MKLTYKNTTLFTSVYGHFRLTLQTKFYKDYKDSQGQDKTADCIKISNNSLNVNPQVSLVFSHYNSADFNHTKDMTLIVSLGYLHRIKSVFGTVKKYLENLNKTYTKDSAGNPVPVTQFSKPKRFDVGTSGQYLSLSLGTTGLTDASGKTTVVPAVIVDSSRFVDPSTNKHEYSVLTVEEFMTVAEYIMNIEFVSVVNQETMFYLIELNSASTGTSYNYSAKSYNSSSTPAPFYNTSISTTPSPKPISAPTSTITNDNIDDVDSLFDGLE